MAQSRKERLEAILDKLRDNNADIEGAALVSPDGLLLAHRISNNGSAEKVAAVSASLVGLGKKFNNTLENGEFNELLLRGSERSTLLFDAGKAVLAITVKPNASMGMVYIDARSAMVAINEVFV